MQKNASNTLLISLFLLKKQQKTAFYGYLTIGGGVLNINY